MSENSAKWVTEDLYLDGDAFYDALIDEIETATQSVDMEVYTFEPGLLAERLCDSFERASLRGVRVRLTFDHWGSSAFDTELHHRLIHAGVKIRIFRGLPWKMVNPKQSGLLTGRRAWIPQVLKRIANINRGFHRKVTIIDEQAAWVGSLNVSDVHLKEVNGATAWADAGIRVSGPEVQVLSNAFKRTFGENVPKGRKSSPCLLVLNDSRFLRGRMNRRFRERIESASARVWIQTPYFLPPRRLLRALCSSAKKGVDVRILVPSKNDYRFIRWMSHQVMEILVRNGVKIFEHTTVFTHKKILLVDDAVFLGSVNFNHRSFLHDLEVEITVTHSSSKALIENSFRQAEKDSQPLTLRRLAAIPNRLKILGRILLFFKYWC